jgi:methionine-rich copper-binding protein CopC
VTGAVRAPIACVLALLVTVVTLVVLPGSAQAHGDILGSSTPAAGAEMASAPAEIRLTFTAALAPIDPLVVVRTADGTSITDGAPVRADGAVVQALVPGAGDGSYTVSWRVVADDGAPSSGTFTFTVGTPASATATGAAASARDADTSAAAASDAGVAWWVWSAGAATLVVLFFLAALVRRRQVRRGSVRPRVRNSVRSGDLS